MIFFLPKWCHKKTKLSRENKKNLKNCLERDQAMLRPIGWPMGRSMGRSLDRSMFRAMCRSLRRPMNRAIGRPMGRPKGMPKTRPKGRPMGRPLGLASGRSMGLPMGRAIWHYFREPLYGAYGLFHNPRPSGSPPTVQSGRVPPLHADGAPTKPTRTHTCPYKSHMGPYGPHMDPI